MQLNLPILDQLADAVNILIAGAGGGFDIYAGLPVYFTLREQGKNVHLANYSFSEFDLCRKGMENVVELEEGLMGVSGRVTAPSPYFPEGYLAQWFAEHGEDVTVWMFQKTGVIPLTRRYRALINHLNMDAIILVDGGVDSLMRGDESGPGTLLEDAISICAVGNQTLKIKLLAAIGFGTEIEEKVCHYHALENMAELAKHEVFQGSCSLLKQMPVFALYEAACRYTWGQTAHIKSHISTRIIPAVHGESGDYWLYERGRDRIFISPLMSIYWFYDVDKLRGFSDVALAIENSMTQDEALALAVLTMQKMERRPPRQIPY